MKMNKKTIISFVVWVWVIASTLFAFTQATTAQRITPVRVNPKTYILDANNDLGKVQVKGTYYVPTPWFEYDNVEWVKAQMLAWLNYDNNFYSSRHITPDVVNGTDSYKTIEWNNPLVLRNLNSVKTKLKGFQFAYRQNWHVKWMDGADVTSAFFSGYGSSSNQTVILYPIKEKAGPNKGKLLWFMEYPCGNLVCRDHACTDLIAKHVCWDGILNKWEQCDPKDPNTREGCTSTCTYKNLLCEVKAPGTNFNQTQDVTGISVNAQSPLTINRVVVNGKTYTNGEWKNIGKLPSGSHKVEAYGTNPYTGKEVICNPGNITVNQKIYCGDGIKNGNEECDHADPSMTNGMCTKSCKLSAVKCDVKVDPKTFKQGDKLTAANFKITTTGEILDKVSHNKKEKTQGDLYSEPLELCGTHTTTFYVKNPFDGADGKTYSCSTTFKVEPKEFCWDGIVQKNEQCDPKDSTTGLACNASCQLSVPTCEITDTLSSYYVNKNAVFAIAPTSNAKIVSITSNDGSKGSLLSGTSNGVIRFKTAGAKEITVGVKNIYDKGKVATGFCKATVRVEEIPKCLYTHQVK